MKRTLALIMGILLVFSVTGYASMMGGGSGSGDSGDMMGGGSGSGDSGDMMGGGSGSMMGGGSGSGMMDGNSGMMSTSMMSNGSFGMNNGMSGAPVVGEDGTAYVMSTVRSGDSSGSFQSVITAVSPQGTARSLSLQGIVSRPVVGGNLLVATSSLPDFNNYNMMGNNGFNNNAPTTGQSVLYAVTLPFTESSRPVAISLDGNFASIPVIANNRIYITTSDYGSAMMTSYGSLQNGQTGKSYLYIFNADGTLASKTEL